jgi:two-component system, NarL family, nitrate/nitrite response regulator NarL
VTARRTSLVLADAHPIVLFGLESLLRQEPDFQIVARCATGDETLVALRRYHPDVVILDLHIRRRDGLELLRQLRREEQPTKVVLLVEQLEDEEVLETLRLGVRGMLLKELALRMVVPCIRKVVAGEPWIEKRAVSRALEVLLRREAGQREVVGLLTPREMEMVRLAAHGLRNEEMSNRLAISEGTVKTHLHRVYRKLNINNRVALTLYAQARQLV